MVLKELEIQGFKSFPDRIKIPIDRGITCLLYTSDAADEL